MSGNRILIVDDIASNIKLLSIVLKKEGYEVHDATDGFTAIEKAKVLRPTLILLDIMMPEIDGYETCRILKENDSTKNIPVIFVTAKTENSDKIKGLNLGAVDYIAKPFHKAEVIARVRNHMTLEETKRSLIESEKKYSTLVENIQDGIFLWQEDNGIIFANSMLYKMLENEYCGNHTLSIDSIFTETSLECVHRVLTHTLEGENVPRESNFEMVNCTHGAFHVSFTPALIQYSGVATVLGTVRDMTERVEFEKRLNQSQKLEAVGSLTSGIVHDFNNILAIVNGYAELALVEIDKNTDLRKKVEFILSAGRGATSLTKGLLAFARGGTIQTNTLDINSEIDVVCGFVEHSLPETIKLNYNYGGEPFYVKLDSGLFQQVVVNLCINARDAMPRGGEINIYLSAVDIAGDSYSVPGNIKEGAYVRVDISDDGVGIPTEIHERIFDPFFTTKDAGTGSGLGLAMVVRIIQDHGGWIDLRSVIGQGTMFSLYLPLTDEVIEEVELHSYKVNSDLKFVLVVDDDEVQANMVRYFLNDGGYDAEIATSGESALDILNHQPGKIKLVVVDYHMPTMNGIELCRKISGLYPDIKVIFTTGGGGLPTVGDRQIRKPFTRDDLLNCIQGL